MKKLLLSLLLGGVFVLSFSGKPPVAHKKCGPEFVFLLSGSLTITRIDVENLTYGTMTTYWNPPQEFFHDDQGGQFYITFYFDGPVHAASYLSTPCCVANVHGQTQMSTEFPMFNCNQTLISVDKTDAHTNAVCR